MRILHVLEPADGGVAKHVRDVVQAQLAQGHAVQAVVTDRGSVATDLRAMGAGVVTLTLRPEMVAPVADLASTIALARLLRGERWDIVHTHGNKAGMIARPLAARRGLPVVHSGHGFAYVTQRHRARRGQTVRRALTLAVERLCAPAARVIVCVSEDEREDALRDRIAPPERLVVVHNGIAPLAPAEPDLRLAALRSPGVPLIGFLARLHPQKAPLLLLDALAELRARGVPFRAALVGDGPLAQRVLERISELGLGDVVIALPFPGAVAPLLACFDVYVLPSLWESLPISLLEAMAAGLPVVAADTGGVREAVANGETGLLHPPGNVAALVSALERLAADAELRARMGAAGRARQATAFSLEAMLAGIDRAYARAVGR
jgi:glycosyltransferase involved in cell wall biosynthesis